MEIVIKISEDDYKEVKEDTYSGTPFENRVFSAIANGTPLPKGHGRLIDADHLKDVSLLHNNHVTNKYLVPYKDRNGYRMRDREVMEALINAETIIEADGGDTETWNGYHGQVTAPNGTFKRIYADADGGDAE